MLLTVPQGTHFKIQISLALSTPARFPSSLADNSLRPAHYFTKLGLPYIAGNLNDCVGNATSLGQHIF
jgi:hypothetical protein